MIKAKDSIMSRLRRQYPLLLAMAVLMAALNLVGSTFSWFTKSDRVENVIRSKERLFSFRIDEDFLEPVVPIEPGNSVEKAVRAENTGDLPGFVRLLVLTEIISADGVPLPADTSVVTFNDVNTSEWLYVNGWWYYLDVLEPGDVTPNIFSGVTFAPSMPDEYQNAGMKIEVKLEAVDIYQWNYRAGWWPQYPSSSAPPAPFDAVDQVLRGLTLTKS